MEESRLKPMGEYNVETFNSIYKNTEKLRRKLSYEIDARRFGVDTEEIYSWFDVKFLYAFTKYHKEFNEDILKGHIIRALQFFKCRILRAAYGKKSVEFTQNIINIGEFEEYENIIIDDSIPEYLSNRDLFIEIATDFMKKHLSENAYELLQIQLNPPPYILNRLEEEEIDIHTKIPNSIIAEYFELGTSNKDFKYIDNLKKEIKEITFKAKQYFETNPIRPVQDMLPSFG